MGAQSRVFAARNSAPEGPVSYNPHVSNVGRAYSENPTRSLAIVPQTTLQTTSQETAFDRASGSPFIALTDRATISTRGVIKLENVRSEFPPPSQQ